MIDAEIIYRACKIWRRTHRRGLPLGCQAELMREQATAELKAEGKL